MRVAGYRCTKRFGVFILSNTNYGRRYNNIGIVGGNFDIVLGHRDDYSQKSTTAMTRTLDFETPEDLLRIKLIVDIIRTTGANEMSKRLALVNKFEKDISKIKKPTTENQKQEAKEFADDAVNQYRKKFGLCADHSGNCQCKNEEKYIRKVVINEFIYRKIASIATTALDAIMFPEYKGKYESAYAKDTAKKALDAIKKLVDTYEIL